MRCRSHQNRCHHDKRCRRQSDSNPRLLFSLPQIVNEGQPLDLGEILASLNQQISDFNKRGSGFEMETIDKVILAMSPFLPESFPASVWRNVHTNTDISEEQKLLNKCSKQERF